MPEHAIQHATLEDLATCGANAPASTTWDLHTTPDGVEVAYQARHEYGQQVQAHAWNITYGACLRIEAPWAQLEEHLPYGTDDPATILRAARRLLARAEVIRTAATLAGHRRHATLLAVFLLDQAQRAATASSSGSDERAAVVRELLRCGHDADQLRDLALQAVRHGDPHARAIRNQTGWANLAVEHALRFAPTTGAGMDDDRQRADEHIHAGLRATEPMLTLLPQVPAHTQLTQRAHVAQVERDAEIRAARAAGVSATHLAQAARLDVEQIRAILDPSPDGRTDSSTADASRSA